MVIRCGRRNTMPMIVAPTMASRAAAPDPSVTPLQPIVPLLRDSSLTEIMVNGPDAIYVERDGKVLLTDRQFDDENHLLGAISALVATTGRRIDFSEPVLEARLPDGSRLTVVLPPVAVDGPMLTIRKFAASPYGIDDLIRFGSLSLEAAELRLPQGHVCRLECIQAGEKTMTIRQLVRHAVRMRPDRLIVGEVRGGEALDMLQAMNTGHDGAMSTIHANSPRDALSRMETLMLMAGLDLPVRAIRQQLRGA